MNKEKIKKEFEEYYKPQDFKCGGCLECEACKLYLKVLWEKTADFWLSKLDAYQSSLLGRIEGINKYPEDIFPEPPEGWQKELDEWAKNKGFRIDNISAHFARWQEKIVKDDIYTLIKEK